MRILELEAHMRSHGFASLVDAASVLNALVARRGGFMAVAKISYRGSPEYWAGYFDDWSSAEDAATKLRTDDRVEATAVYIIPMQATII